MEIGGLGKKAFLSTYIDFLFVCCCMIVESRYKC